jgi:SpoVK/Ycf46/Vps4 family AAA+-type ATPase
VCRQTIAHYFSYTSGDSFSFQDKDGTMKSELDTSKVSWLLNLLDGINTPFGSVFILTCNDRSKLPPALLRAGRVDREFEFKFADDYQVERLACHFDLKPKPFLRHVTQCKTRQGVLGFTMSDLQVERSDEKVCIYERDREIKHNTGQTRDVACSNS